MHVPLFITSHLDFEKNSQKRYTLLHMQQLLNKLRACLAIVYKLDTTSHAPIYSRFFILLPTHI